MNTRDRIEQLEEDVDDLQHQLDAVVARLEVLEAGDAMSLPPATLEDEWIAPEQTDPGILATLDALSGVNAGIDW